MIQVDFYVLPSGDNDSRLLFLQKLATRAISAGLQIFIWLENEPQARQLQEHLWRSEPEFFLPSCMPQDTIKAPILIGWLDEHLPTHSTMLINLATRMAPDANFNRIAEIVIQEPVILDTTRTRYKEYQAKGWSPSLHDMRKPS